MKKVITLIGVFLAGALAHGQGISGDYLRLAPNSLPSACKKGDVRIDTSGIVQVCSATNTFSALISGTPLTLAKGGTGADLSATGGTHQVLKQSSSGAVVTVGQLACADLSTAVASCSTDTTNAANISSGVLAVARGGAGVSLSATGGTHQVLKQVSSGANITVGQLACADLSDSVSSCSTDATNASNISSGTLGAGRLPNPSASTLGGIESIAAVSHNFLTSISTSGVPAQAQPAFSDISSTAAVNQGGTGNTTYTDGQLLIGNSSGNTLTKAPLTAGANITITNGNGSISIAASSSANPAYNETPQTTTYSAVISDWVVASSSSFTITLPTAVGQSGKSILVQHAGTNLTQVYTIHTTSSQTITLGGKTYTNTDINTNGLVAAVTAGEWYVFFSDGANWNGYHYANTDWVDDATGLVIDVTGGGTAVTLSNSPTVNKVFWRREGKYVIERYDFTASTATGSSNGSGGDYKIKLSPNITADTTNYTLYTTVVGNAAAYHLTNYIGGGDVGYTSSAAPVSAALFDSTHFRAFTNVGSAINGALCSAANANITGAVITYHFEVRLPVAAWLP